MTKKEKHPEIVIQLVKSEEVELLATIARNTFVAAFGHFNKKDDMNHYLEAHMTTSNVIHEVNTAGTYFYFARLNNELVGYLKLNIDQAQNEPIGPLGFEIERIYVNGDFQGKGIGQQLLDFSLAKAREWKKSTAWLGVWDRNPGAIKLYQRNGFELFGSHDFKLGNDLQTDLLMKLELDDQGN